MNEQDQQIFVSENTQALFGALAISGVSIAALVALISSAYADGGNYVLDCVAERGDRSGLERA
jgi:hypothetical protein